MKILMLLDAILAFAAIVVAAFIRFSTDEISRKLGSSETFVSEIVFIAVVIFSSYLMENYDIAKNGRKREIAVNILFGTFTAFSIISVISYVFLDVVIGRGVFFISLLIFALMQFLLHSLYLGWRKGSAFYRKVLVLGTGHLAAQIGAVINSADREFALAGYAKCRLNSDRYESESTQTVVPSEQIVGNSDDDLLDLARETGAEIIAVALSEKRGVFPLKDVLKCKYNGIQILDAPTMFEIVERKLMLEHITPSWFIFSGNYGWGATFTFYKRTADILLSLIGLLIVLPFLPLIALAIKLDSTGPVFFRQERVGLKDSIFVLYKFRTMRQDAESSTGAVWAEKNDPRVTKLGRFFRGSRIDEIPQLFNVLKGDMSFIGPRPERPEFVEKLKLVIPYYSNRHYVKPGVTGWAQVRYPYGASIEDAVEKLRYDLYYIKNISPALDMLVFFETIKVVLFGFGGR